MTFPDEKCKQFSGKYAGSFGGMSCDFHACTSQANRRILCKQLLSCFKLIVNCCGYFAGIKDYMIRVWANHTLCYEIGNYKITKLKCEITQCKLDHSINIS